MKTNKVHYYLSCGCGYQTRQYTKFATARRAMRGHLFWRHRMLNFDPRDSI